MLIVVGADRTTVLLATSKGPNNEAEFEIIALPTQQATPVGMAQTLENLSLIASRRLGLPYGWGGLFNNRDCSALIRDFFMPCGPGSTLLADLQSMNILPVS